ncbi:MAG: hypothetical protein H6916_08130 [Novosphingobium sp.]|uniref:hypothetical protein n=1 Tax=Novosphingobium sp. TaxID=1874826 RepID=UPI0026090F3A|nr:hypothetical protein [Novosphingobium sp.]MCP5386770.1 hypothetical protein [Novosphingobium sp.]
MTDFPLAHAIHVLAVLMWIGGVGFVTLVLLPAMRILPEAERLGAFHRFEGRFAPQARLWVLLAGASGFWMVWRTDMWNRFANPHYWWMHAMVCVWAIFFAMLIIIEPLFLHRRMATSPAPQKDMRRMIAMHRILLALSLVTVLGAAAGSHGFY